jgi:predicted RNA-binding Zn-ribbon protein involved in translation (DUF1610 family)
VGKRAPDRARIRELERELITERQAGFSCPVCGVEEFEERSVWRGDDEGRNEGERYHYWACVPNDHDVSPQVAPGAPVTKHESRPHTDPASPIEAVSVRG